MQDYFCLLITREDRNIFKATQNLLQVTKYEPIYIKDQIFQKFSNSLNHIHVM